MQSTHTSTASTRDLHSSHKAPEPLNISNDTEAQRTAYCSLYSEVPSAPVIMGPPSPSPSVGPASAPALAPSYEQDEHAPTPPPPTPTPTPSPSPSPTSPISQPLMYTGLGSPMVDALLSPPNILDSRAGSLGRRAMQNARSLARVKSWPHFWSGERARHVGSGPSRERVSEEYEAAWENNEGPVADDLRIEIQVHVQVQVERENGEPGQGQRQLRRVASESYASPRLI